MRITGPRYGSFYRAATLNNRGQVKSWLADRHEGRNALYLAHMDALDFANHQTNRVRARVVVAQYLLIPGRPFDVKHLRIVETYK